MQARCTTWLSDSPLDACGVTAVVAAVTACALGHFQLDQMCSDCLREAQAGEHLCGVCITLFDTDREIFVVKEVEHV